MKEAAWLCSTECCNEESPGARSQSTIAKKAREIFESFIAPNVALMEVNVPNTERSELSELFEKSSDSTEFRADVFDAAIDAIFPQLNADMEDAVSTILRMTKRDDAYHGHRRVWQKFLSQQREDTLLISMAGGTSPKQKTSAWSCADRTHMM